DPEFLGRQQLQEEARRSALEDYRANARGVLADLSASGFKVESVGELVRLGEPYPNAVPILMHWLSRVEDRCVKADIVRTLSVPGAAAAGPLLVSEFERVEDASGLGLRWAVGSALEVLATEKIADDMIRLATAPRYGRSREMVVLGLGKLKQDRVV